MEVEKLKEAIVKMIKDINDYEKLRRIYTVATNL